MATGEFTTEVQGEQKSRTMEIATTRQAQEVQAAMVIAKKFPRDETEALGRILRSCKRKGLAEAALYAYPRGGQTVTGPSIRLAEALAQGWGNIDYGMIELEHKDGESTVMAYAWDLETNTRETIVFSVEHLRYTKQGTYALTDPRDIYEMMANQGARRMRKCILGIIPGDIVDQAVGACEKTLKGGSDKPLADRVRDMVLAFNEQGVTKEMIVAKLGHSLDATIEAEFVNLRKVYTSIKDGASKREDWFEIDAGKGSDSESKPKSRTEKAAEKVKKQEPQDASETGATDGATEHPALTVFRKWVAKTNDADAIWMEADKQADKQADELPDLAEEIKQAATERCKELQGAAKGQKELLP